MCQEKNISKLFLKRKGPYYMLKYLIQMSVLTAKATPINNLVCWIRRFYFNKFKL